MRKFKVRWYEDTVEEWENIIEAETLEEALLITKELRSEMLDGADMIESHTEQGPYDVKIFEMFKPEVYLRPGEKIISEERFPEVICDNCNCSSEKLGGGIAYKNDMYCPDCFDRLSAEDKTEAFDIEKSFQENGRNWRFKHYGDPDGFIIITSME